MIGIRAKSLDRTPPSEGQSKLLVQPLLSTNDSGQSKLLNTSVKENQLQLSRGAENPIEIADYSNAFATVR